MHGEQEKNDAIAWIEKNGLIDYGGAKKKVFLEQCNIPETTFRRWMKEPEWCQRVEEAKRIWKQEVKEKAFTGLMKLCEGYEVEEKHTEYVPNAQGKPIINKQKVYTKHIPPNPTAIMFALTNLDPEHYKNRQDVDNTFRLDGIQVNINSKGGLPARKVEDVNAVQEGTDEAKAIEDRNWKKYHSLNENMQAMLAETEQEQTEEAEAKVIDDAELRTE